MLAEVKDIYTLFIQDDSISDAKKKNLTPLYKPASSRLLFLAKLISFGMERQFIKRNTKNQKLLAGGALSPIVLDYIMDSEIPKPCRHFIGRDKELEELYTMLIHLSIAAGLFTMKCILHLTITA